MLQCVPEMCALAQAAHRGGQSALEAELAQLKHELQVLGPALAPWKLHNLCQGPLSLHLCGASSDMSVLTSAAPRHACPFLTAPVLLCAQRLDSLPEQLAAAQAANMVLQSRMALLEQRSAADASSAGNDEDGGGLTSLVSSMLQPVQHALDALAQDLLVLKAAAPAPAPTEPAPVAASGEAPADAVTAASGGTVSQGAGHADVSETAAGAGRLGADLDAAGASSGVQPGTGSAETVTPASPEPDLPALSGERGGWQTSPESPPGKAAGEAEQRSLQLALAPLHERLAAAEAALHGLAHVHSAAVGAELDALAESVSGLQGRMAQQAAQLHDLMEARSGPRVESSALAVPGVPAQGGTQDPDGSTQAATPGDATVPRMGAQRSQSGLQVRPKQQAPDHSLLVSRSRCYDINPLLKLMDKVKHGQQAAGRKCWQHVYSASLACGT